MLPYLFRKIQFKFGPFPKFLTILEIDLKTFPILNLVLKQPHDSFVMVQIQPGGLQHISCTLTEPRDFGAGTENCQGGFRKNIISSLLLEAPACPRRRRRSPPPIPAVPELVARG